MIYWSKSNPSINKLLALSEFLDVSIGVPANENCDLNTSRLKSENETNEYISDKSEYKILLGEKIKDLHL